MSSRAHRWPAGATPLSRFHGGSAKAALLAVKGLVEPKLKLVEPLPGRRVRRRGSSERGEEIIIPPPAKTRKRPGVRNKWRCRPDGRVHRPGATLPGTPPRDAKIVAMQREKLLVAQCGVCGLCGDPLPGEAKLSSIDHVIPRFDGGKDALGNLLLCHGECNGRKTNDVPTGCELVVLIATNARLGVEPVKW